MNRSLVLAFDTSTDMATLALLRRQGSSFEPVAARTMPSARSHTHSLLRIVQECLDEVRGEANLLGGVVVGIGPGTFTGVRIAVATARALALSLSIPVLGVPSLAGLAAGALEEGLPAEVGTLVPLVDARRGQVFGAVYQRQPAAGSPAWTRMGDLFVIEPERVAEAARAQAPGLSDEPVFVGAVGGVPGSARSSILHARHLVQGQDCLLEPLTKVQRLESWMADQIDHSRDYSDALPASLGTPEAVNPVYVRAPDADLHITKMRDPWAS